MKQDDGNEKTEAGLLRKLKAAPAKKSKLLSDSISDRKMLGRKAANMSCKDKTKQTGKFLSLILRHSPETIGITLDEHGWADVSELIAGINKTRPIDMKLLEEIVERDEKQRYSFNDDKTLIRANQGHSVHVDVELEERIPPNPLWHGTGEKFTESIDKIGLIPKSRLYVHLSADKKTAEKVGSRHGKPVIYQIDTEKMVKDGHKFYCSANGVWLIYNVPREYLKKT